MQNGAYRLCHIDEFGNYYGDVIEANSRPQAIQLFKKQFNLEPSAYVLVDRVTEEEAEEKCDPID
ncbi:Uncharacterised protein [Alloiococcus otitis]|uniref:Uncharacterized protein n=1 Tax=Alloiococcus otitis ATCC 51267 TaxID=883081 RepID=K9EBB9_9LACT|nr:hypothetical protein [Alloiococcus otitis]EKU93156.1 hypothetical protein HMPREF9698_01498 [Alloiococcus otitis ATCC 51267]SUU80679.1 Uncharacterised protein [Alloiococcus otitis]SUU91693.1 Uncharacterised protein [Alloiococcus otitis]